MATPRKHTTGYMMYASNTRFVIKEANPTLSTVEISGIIGQNWKKLSEAEKNVWSDKYEEANRNYKRALHQQQVVTSEERHPSRRSIPTELPIPQIFENNR